MPWAGEAPSDFHNRLGKWEADRRRLLEEWDKTRLRPGEWVVSLQENTRQVSISCPGAKPSRVLQKVGVDYGAGYPCKFLYAADVYMRINDPDIVV